MCQGTVPFVTSQRAEMCVVMLAEEKHFPYLRSSPDIIVQSELCIICDL